MSRGECLYLSWRLEMPESRDECSSCHGYMPGD